MSSLPASIKRIRSKTTEKRWRHHFPLYKSICPKTLCSLSPTPMMLHIKFDHDWPTGFRDIQVQKCEIFVIQGQVTPKFKSLIRPEIKLVQAFMPVLVTTNFDDDSIKNERASTESAFSHYKSMGNFLDAQGQLTPSQWSNQAEILCMSLLPASIKRIGSKTTEKRWRHSFPHYKSMGAFCCHGNLEF